jgi:hypothetical protein
MANYPNIAAKYPDLKGAAVAQAATPAMDTKKLDSALTSIESILAKYKIKLSEDRESSTTDQMKQWRSLMELTKAETEAAAANRAAKQAANQSAIDAQAKNFGQVKNFGPYATAPAQIMPYTQAAQQAAQQTKAEYDRLTAKAAGAAKKGTAGAAKGAVGALGKGVAKLSPGVGLALAVPDVYDRTKAGDYTGAAISGLAGLASLVPLKGTAIALGLGGLNAWLDSRKTPTVAISAEDAKTIIDNIEIMQNWAKDPANQNALTPELKTRIANNIKAVNSLGIVTQAATPAATQQADTPAAQATSALPTAISAADRLDKLLKKNNFESREYTTSGEQLARYRDIVNEAPPVPEPVKKTIAQWAGAALEPVARKTLQGVAYPVAAVAGGTGAWEAIKWYWKWYNAPAAMSAEDKAEFERIMAEFRQAVPDEATFMALPQPEKDKWRALLIRLEKMEKQGK